MPAGRFFMTLFFLALMFAAWSSLISMIELATRVLVDGGLARRRALMVVAGAGFLLGVPSALSETSFQNQDWVWGVGLMVSGLFFAIAVLRYGATRFREELINTEYADIRIGRWWDWAIRLVVVQAVILVIWWISQFGTEEPWGRYGIWNTLLSRHPVASVTPFAMLVPVFGIGAAALAFGERPTPLELLGGLVLLAGVATAVLRRRSNRPSPPSRGQHLGAGEQATRPAASAQTGSPST